MNTKAILGLFVLAGAWPAMAAFDAGSDGTDGALTIDTTSTTVDLSLAASLCDCNGTDENGDGDFLDDTCRWDCPSPVAGQGVYDEAKWAVVFKYTTVTIDSTFTVDFTNHPSGAPVIWLVQGDVTINGTVSLKGADGVVGSISDYADGGPGGFEGGIGISAGGIASGGFGPGAGQRGFFAADKTAAGGGGSYGCLGTQGGYGVGGLPGSTYGNIEIMPLIGGSGGGGANRFTHTCNQGGGGGGAILIACGDGVEDDAGVDCTFSLDGSITADGGSGLYLSGAQSGGGGSGGAIRIIADTIRNSTTAAGALTCDGGSGYWTAGTGHTGNGGCGVIRLEAISYSFDGNVSPGVAPVSALGPVFPPAPVTLRVVTVDGEPVPEDPEATVITRDVSIANPGPVTIAIEATGIPTGATAFVTVMIVPARGAVVIAPEEPLNTTTSTATASIDMMMPAGRVEIQLVANWAP